jgi:hypothetical protein
MTNPHQQRIDALRNRLAEIAGNREFTIERGLLRDELRWLRAPGDEVDYSEDEAPVTSGDSVWETLRKIASMEDTLKIMCEDKTVNPQVLMAAGFRGAIRLAKQALKDAGKDTK